VKYSFKLGADLSTNEMYFWNSLISSFHLSISSRRAHAVTAATRLLYFPTAGGPKDILAQQKGNRSTLPTDVDNMDLILSCLGMRCLSVPEWQEKRCGHASRRLAEQMTHKKQKNCQSISVYLS